MGSSENEYRFEGCFVEKVESPLGGGLVEGMRSEYNHFLALNSSYSQCVRRENADPVIGNKSMESQIVNSGDATFVNCDFNNLSNENSSRSFGGAIVFSSSGLLNVTLCKFHSCHSIYCGGAISSRQTGKNFVISSSEFDSCTAEASGGCIDFYYVSTLSMKNINCSNSSTKHTGGGIFIEKNEYQGIVERCNFFCCCRKNTTYYDEGGSVGFYNDVAGIFTDCSICGGYSERHGAGFGWTKGTGVSDIQIIFCFFSNNTSENLGHDIYAVEGWTNITENSFVLCRSSTAADNNRVVIGTTEYNNWIPKVFFNPVFVNSQEGLDHMACGFVRAADEYGRRCKTIEFGMSVLDGDGSSNEVIIEFGDYEENKIDVGKMRIAFEGKDKAQVVVRNRSPNGESLVAIDTGVGSFRKITFVCGENPSSHLMEVLAEKGMLKLVECVITSSSSYENCVLTASLMIVQKGSVSFDSVEISGISFSSVPAFDVRGESSLSFQMNNVDAFGISRVSGDGSVICGNLVNGMNVNVSRGMMKNCGCEDGCGGGMWIQLDEGSKMEIGNVSSEGADENVERVTFRSCSCVGKGNGVGGYGGALYLDVVDEDCAFCIHCARFEDCQAEKGNNMFVNAQCLRDVVSHTTFGFAHEGMTDDDLLGFEDGCREECVPLLSFLMEAGDVGFVGGEKSMDFSRCGLEHYPCSSIKRVVELWFGAVPRTIRIKNGFVLCEEVVMESQFWNVSGTTGGTAIEVVVPPALQFDSECLIRVSSEALLKDMCFSLPSALSPASSFIISSSNALSVSDCSIEPAIGNSLNEIEFCVFQIEGGVLHMTGFSNKGSLNTLSDPIIRCAGECSAELSNCVLTGISRRNGEGSCLERSCDKKEIENSDTSIVDVIIITNCTFSEYGVEEKDGCGGGMKISIGKDEGVAINGSTTFDGCKTENEADSNGRGGGMMITVGSGGSLKMKEVKFEGCEVPSGESDEVGRGLGGGMFVELPNQLGTFILEGMTFEGCNAWKGKNVFLSGWDLREIVNKEKFKWEMSDEELGSLGELCGWERKTTGEGYVIPLVVYLWDNWSGNGFVTFESGKDFSGCGYSVAPCSSVDHLVSLRYATLETEESKIIVSGSGLLRSSISFLSSSSSNTPVVKIEGEIYGTVLRIAEEKEKDGENGDAMVASEVILSFVNVSFSLPNVLVHHLSFLKSSSMNGALSVKSCSFACEDPSKETDFCLVKVDGGSVAIEDCALKEFHFSHGLMELSSDVKVADVMNLSITNTSISGRSLISLSESALSSASLLKGATMLRGKENGDGVMLLSINSSSFTSITCNDSRATIVNGGSFDGGMKCCVEKCVMTKCLSEKSEEGGGMKVSLRSGGSELKVSGCSFGMCICSIVKGRGGGLMIDASGLGETEAGTEDAPPLGIMIESTRFTMNDAFVGKDMFIRCKWIEKQINETLFSLDFSQDALKLNNSICGSDEENRDIDLVPLITFYYGQQVFVEANGRDIRQCGEQTNPCKSISHGVSHIQKGIMNAIFIDGEGDIGGECVMGDVSVKPMKKVKATIHFNATVQEMGNEGNMIAFVNECVVERCVFEFGEQFSSSHSCIMKVKNGTTEMRECECLSSTFVLTIHSTIMGVEGGELEMVKCVFTRMKLSVPLIEFIGESKAAISETKIDDFESEGNVIEIGDRAEVEMKELDVQNITLSRSGSAVHMQNLVKNEVLSNCSFGKCLSSKEKGSIVSVSNCANVRFDLCRFSGDLEEEAREERKANERTEEVCKWKGSVVDAISSSLTMKYTTISNSKKGGLSLSGGSFVIEKGEFENNNPSVEGYPSLRRNIICADSGTLNVMSLKGGDGVLPNTSFWILDEGCQFGGIAAERASPFFIPVLEDVKNTTQPSGELELIIHGKLLLPCDLSVKISMKNGDEEEIMRKGIDEEDCVSENEVHSTIYLELLKVMETKAEVSMCILFGKADSPSSTESFILKNRSESVGKGDDRIAEGGKEGKSYWLLIVCVAIVVMLLIASIIFIVRWKKVKERNEELQEIVNDNIRKDPKLIEMVTMEMSPEEQWRRAERETEKKNEERIKKRVYEKSLGHSESSEHLLSESGSTEYILGKDSDKIPEWVLEKDEEEEIRKRTPSPSISSSSTTDSDSTFVRREDLCPTTSSMSNLVDAMACSSPHEKLIVDLRDSLFMLLHGRNEKKEMAIGSLQEREVTAAQILFWVANGALHSFDEMEIPLQSLANLSPHIVLFSEHMVICIVMHSDLLSDDSDSSSISSSTVVTSASDDESDSLPSSAFEEENEFKKECLRWKAPEQQMNKKMEATKESVVFSIGMMLWECLTLQIPFGEYDAETAGQKIVHGERPDVKKMESVKFEDIARSCLMSAGEDRPRLVDVRRMMFERMPGAAMLITQSDAICDSDDGCGGDNNDGGRVGNGADKSQVKRRTTEVENERNQ
ncbi:uncharacterized protein MONOS_3919 [Monocercomonoides exilis]|uniref:uncharacterized protein n=1 Tax=Monocercomonoides exilis TaxID=2049356 RepID=UPI00355A13CB|nr:hypothetical protein MONOS_3919 [Monocercomonoides exilis]|eukprot:MONOS_3919.1-p1 / transcript=MONOS_3919.1 / gene=MONOS_3919 / organism=Monocercomonoides_exilis_PA203 / gene_product=unspecified product / transcript_product=unspecified product / location=Mono_scaffold00097:67065-74384(-) / protein_length=2439 / sequence_SO=supercontig / SO=protein_coding / is_pseudo=false